MVKQFSNVLSWLVIFSLLVPLANVQSSYLPGEITSEDQYYADSEFRADTITYSISGKVLDSQGNPGTGVTITATADYWKIFLPFLGDGEAAKGDQQANMAPREPLMASYTVITDMNGDYIFPALPAGPYTVSIDAAQLRFQPSSIYLILSNPVILDFSAKSGISNLSPYVPASPLPLDGATGQSLAPNLSWIGGDPNGDGVSYTVYLDKATPPGKIIATGLQTTSITPGILETNTTYYWKIVTHDEHGAVATGTVWQFTTLNSLAGEMVTVPAGTFQMGCVVASGAYGCYDFDEKPSHTVSLNAFQIDKYEVSNAQYAACVAWGACGEPSSAGSYLRSSYYNNPLYANYPVIYVDWQDAANYCSWAGKRLPTEAEWEKTARGSTDTRTFPWGEDYPDCFVENGLIERECLGDTNAVGSYPAGASPYGAMDMIGNVWEWVADWYGYDYYANSPASNPTGPESGLFKGLRGGGWDTETDNSEREYAYPVFRSRSIGFRCAASIDNNEPYILSNPAPADAAVGQALTTILDWTAGDPNGDAITFTVSFGTTNPPPVVSVGQINSAYYPGLLAAGTTYYWKIVVTDSSGLTAASPIWQFTTNHNPDAPHNPSPGHLATNQSLSADISWQGSDLDGDALTYDVYWGTTNPPGALAANDIDAMTYDPGLLAPNTTYYWQVIASDTFNLTQASPVWRFSTTRLPDLLGNPVPANGSINQSLSTTLGWTGGDPDNDAVIYTLYLGTSNPPTIPVFQGQNVETYQPAQLSGNTTYYWRVSAEDVNGGTQAGPVWRFTTINNAKPDSPSNPVPADAAMFVSTSTTISWTGSDPDGDAVAFDLYFEAEDTTPDVLAADNLLSSSYPLGILAANTTYYWQVISTDEHGDSQAGAVWKFTTAGSENVEMVYIPAGDFARGCDPAHNSGQACHASQLLAYLFISSFYIDKFEVTNDQYAQCVASGQCSPPVDNSSYSRVSYYGNLVYASYPVIRVDWQDAFNYCAWAGKRLPTEAEWEKAARGSTDRRTFPWGDSAASCSHANILNTCVGDTTPVGGYADDSSPYGVMDMAGNVFEWVNDWYGENYYATASKNNPLGPSNGTARVLRGGSFANYPPYSIAGRYYSIPTTPAHDYGFRCAVSAQNKAPNTPISPNPANSASGISRTPVLSWQGGDSDSDTVNYDVYFDSETPPARLVSAGQQGASFTPAKLLSGTTYYWQIVAEDEHGLQTSSPIWQFTTYSTAPNRPSLPTPADGLMGLSTDIKISWSGGDLDGDEVTYDVYLSSLNPPVELVSNHQSGLTYEAGPFATDTTYYWQIIAEDELGQRVSGPVWSFSTAKKMVYGDSIFIPAGDFAYGCDAAHNGGYSCIENELPSRTVYLDAFYIDKYEVTNYFYEQCVNAGHCTAPLDTSSPSHQSYYGTPAFYNFPVINLNWQDAENYCSWAGKRLPSEAEWVKAARGSTDTRAFPWGDDPATCNLANFNTCMGDTSAVGSKPAGASPYGAMDMAGNVWEWVNDWYDEDYYTYMPLSNPPGPSTGTEKILHGGLWMIEEPLLRISYRYPDFPTNSGTYIGFRCAASMENHAPDEPANPSPGDLAVTDNNQVDLSWSANDVDGDGLTYDVYWGTSSPPTDLVSNNRPETSFNAGLLATDTTYYWRIIARDAHNRETPGPVWRFTTGVMGSSLEEMILIPAGDFSRGCDSNNNHQTSCSVMELPSQTIYLDGFFIDKYEVTNYQYEQCVLAGSCTAPVVSSSSTRLNYYGNPAFYNYPVVNVLRQDAINYCSWADKRLPTEAEWEKAARGSTDTRPFPWGNDTPTCELVNYQSCTGDTSPVGSRLSGASPYGVMDMAGNVEEWVNDWLDINYYSYSPLSNPTGPAEGYISLLRGGSGLSTEDSIRTTYRYGTSATAYDMFDGFRCAASVNNHAPEAPSSPYPYNSAANMSTQTVVSWVAGDFDRDSVTYDIYWDTTNPPLYLAANDQVENTYRPDLAANTQYYWRIAVKDEHGLESLGPVWSLTTENGSAPTGMVLVPAGNFVRGCDVAHNNGYACWSSTLPSATIYLDAYYIDITEVTNRDYEQCVTSDGCAAPNQSSSYLRAFYYGDPAYASYPVIQVTWNQALSYCLWAGKRLPTEAEWEKAARGNVDTRPYPWGESAPTCELANHRFFAGYGYMDCIGDTSAAGNSPLGVSLYGALDMAGNVSEWVSDWFSANYYSISPSINPPGPVSGTGRVLRGGHWYASGSEIQAVSRYGVDPTTGAEFIGFRCAAAAP